MPQTGTNGLADFFDRFSLSSKECEPATSKPLQDPLNFDDFDCLGKTITPQL